MATVEELARKVAQVREEAEMQALWGTDWSPDAVTLGYIQSKQTTFYNEVLAACIPSGGKFIGIFTVTCPNGWTRLTAMDGYFPYGATTYGTTGGVTNGSHTHSYDSIGSHTHEPGFDIAAGGSSHSHSYSIRAGQTGVDTGATTVVDSSSSDTTGSSGAHTHGVSGTTASSGESSQTTGSGGTLPPYIDVVLCTAT